MWFYSQTTGQLTHNGEPIGRGYSGHGAGLNNPLLQGIAGVGPCPQGVYTFGPFTDDHPHLGPMVARLTPVPPNDAMGRTLLDIHGDNAQMNHTASDGCIILNRLIRMAMRDSPDKQLTVIK